MSGSQTLWPVFEAPRHPVSRLSARLLWEVRRMSVNPASYITESRRVSDSCKVPARLAAE